MKKILVAFSIIFSVSLHSQEWKSILSKDIVSITDNKMIAEDLTGITFEGHDEILQVKSYAEAPLDSFISRDQFVSVFSTGIFFLISDLVTELGYTDNQYDTKTLNVEDLIGKPDVELFFYMNSKGIQIIVSSQGGEEKITRTWDSVFK